MKYKILSTETGDELSKFTADTDKEAIRVFKSKVKKWEEKSGESLAGEYSLKEDISEETERSVANN